jgi:hypothetical protein
MSERQASSAAQSHDCPAVNALLDILDLEAGWVAPAIQAKNAEEKLALIYSTAKKALDETR